MRNAEAARVFNGVVIERLMFRQREPRRLGVCALLFALLSASASAESTDRDGTLETNPAALDYATFVLELLAFVAKEVLPDSQDEFPESLIGSRLSDSMPEKRSEFGSHCLTIVTRLGSAVPYLSASNDELGAGSVSPPALRRMWSAFENGAGDDRRDVALNFKVGVNKVGISLTFHW